MEVEPNRSMPHSQMATPRMATPRMTSLPPIQVESQPASPRRQGVSKTMGMEMDALVFKNRPISNSELYHQRLTRHLRGEMVPMRSGGINEMLRKKQRTPRLESLPSPRNRPLPMLPDWWSHDSPQMATTPVPSAPKSQKPLVPRSPRLAHQQANIISNPTKIRDPVTDIKDPSPTSVGQEATSATIIQRHVRGHKGRQGELMLEIHDCIVFRTKYSSHGRTRMPSCIVTLSSQRLDCSSCTERDASYAVREIA